MSKKFLSDKTIEREIARIATERERADEKLLDTLAALNMQEREIRDRCKHTKTTYHPDASGNNDSSNTCDICGREVPRR